MNTQVQTLTTPTAYVNEVIGTVTITDQSDPIHENHTSYAADHRTFTVLPGTYTATLVCRGDAASQGYVIVTVDIEVTNETLYSGIGGVNYSSDSNDTVRKSTKTYQIYDYVAAEAAGAREPALAGGAFRLNPEWIVTTKHITFSDGRHYTARSFAKIS